MGSQISPNPNPYSSTWTLIPKEGDYNATIFKNLGFITNNITFTNKAGGVFNTDQELANFGTFENSAGAILNNWGDILSPGLLINSTGAIYNNNSEGMLGNSGSIQNNGTMNIHNGRMINSQGGTINNQGTLEFQLGKLYNGALYDSGQNGQTGTLINDGSIQISKRGSFVNEKNGLIMGTGTIQGDVNNFGVINGGKSAGGHLIDGTLHHKQSGRITIELGGSNDANRDRRKTEYDFIDITEDLIIDGGKLDVSLIGDFRIQRGQEFIITRLGGELIGRYDGLEEGDSIGQFESIGGNDIDLRISYIAGDGNDISLYTDPLTNPEMIFGYI